LVTTTTIKLETVAIDDIFPSPENDGIYGAVDKDADLANLANDIIKRGMLEPIQVSRDSYIISGHRRFAAAKWINLATIQVHRRKDIVWKNSSVDDWKRILRAHNHQRVKSSAVRLKEVLLDINPKLAHAQLIAEREERDRDAPPQLSISGEKTRSGISERKQQFLDAAMLVVNDLKDYWPVTVRQVHYGLLNTVVLRNSSTGAQRSTYENNPESYSDLCNLLTRARLSGFVPWEAISDETRATSGTCFNKDVAQFVESETRNFLRGYRRDLLQSQHDHMELIVEKLTVQGIIQPIANQFCLPMTVARGYCSIEPRHAIVQRFKKSGKDRLKLLIASDFDPDGEEIAESFVRSIRDDFGIDDVSASKILLRQDQIESMKLPNNGMEAKESSSKYKKFFGKYGEDFVFELEAVPPKLMQQTVQEAIEATIDLAAFNSEVAQEEKDAAVLQAMKSSVAESFSNMLQNGSEEP